MKRNELWNELTAGFENDPLYRAEEIATNIAMEVDRRLEEYRVSRKELASRLLVSRSYVTQLLNGHSNMTLRSLCKLAYALELQVDVDLHPRYQPATFGSAYSTVAVLPPEYIFEFDASTGSFTVAGNLGLSGSVTIYGGFQPSQKLKGIASSTTEVEVEKVNEYKEDVA